MTRSAQKKKPAPTSSTVVQFGTKKLVIMPIEIGTTKALRRGIRRQDQGQSHHHTHTPNTQLPTHPPPTPQHPPVGHVQEQDEPGPPNKPAHTGGESGQPKDGAPPCAVPRPQHPPVAQPPQRLVASVGRLKRARDLLTLLFFFFIIFAPTLLHQSCEPGLVIAEGADDEAVHGGVLVSQLLNYLP